MENEEKPNYSTLKEEPAMPTPPPPTFPTPAHPFPKFLPKPIALIVIVLIATALLSGLVFTVYNLGKKSVSNQNTPATVSQSPTPTPDLYTENRSETADWKTYNWLYQDKNYFSIKYPSGLDLFEYEKLATYFFPKGFDPRNLDGKTTHFGIAVVDNNPENCKGDCPVIDKSLDISVSGIKARKLEGYIGSAGGNNPKKYIEVIIPKDDAYINFIIYGKNMEEISSEDIKTFNQMLSTFKFE